jgi:hypothetical protein
MAVTIATIIENVCLSRRRKAEFVIYRNLVQTPEILVLLLALKPDQSHVCPVCPESIQHHNLISKVRSYQTMCQNRPYE